MPFSNGSKWPVFLNMVVVVGAVCLEAIRAYLRWQASRGGGEHGG